MNEFPLIRRATDFGIKYLKTVVYKNSKFIGVEFDEYPLLSFEEDGKKELVLLMVKCTSNIKDIAHSDKYYNFKKIYQNVVKILKNHDNQEFYQISIYILTLKYFVTFCSGNINGYYDSGLLIENEQIKKIKKKK